MCLPTENARKSSLKVCLVHNHILGEDEGEENGWSEEILKKSKHILKKSKHIINVFEKMRLTLLQVFNYD